MDNDLIAYCGADCSVCRDFTDGKCPGCRQTLWQNEEPCMPVSCCRGKNISCCGECDKFPCEDMKEFYGESESHSRAYERMSAIGRNKTENS